MWCVYVHTQMLAVQQTPVWGVVVVSSVVCVYV
jgi:hypothetical protein